MIIGYRKQWSENKYIVVHRCEASCDYYSDHSLSGVVCVWGEGRGRGGDGECSKVSLSRVRTFVHAEHIRPCSFGCEKSVYADNFCGNFLNNSNRYFLVFFTEIS